MQSDPIRDRTLGAQRFQQTLFTRLEIFTCASLEDVLRQDESARQGVSPLQLLIERESIIFLFSSVQLSKMVIEKDEQKDHSIFPSCPSPLIERESIIFMFLFCPVVKDGDREI